MALLIALLVGALGFVAWVWYRTHRPITSNGTFSVEAVGESHYQPALRAICGKGKVRHECVATLDLDDNNPHDNLAVKVSINGATVGYLSKNNARIYRKRNGNVYSRNVPAIIVGGGKGKQSVGIWLDIA